MKEKTKRISIGLPPAIRKIIKQQVGILGTSEAEVVKNMVLIYLTERGFFKKDVNKNDKV